MCSNRNIPPLARRAIGYRPPFHASAASPAVIEVLDMNGICAAITFPTEAVVADGEIVQLGEAMTDALNLRFRPLKGNPTTHRQRTPQKSRRPK